MSDTTPDPDLHRGARVDDDAVLPPDEEATPDTSVDISVEEVAELPKGKMLEVDDVTLRFGQTCKRLQRVLVLVSILRPKSRIHFLQQFQRLLWISQCRQRASKL